MINLSFCDFWDSFNFYDNFFSRYFYNLFKNKIKITSIDNANVVIYSVFGNNHTKLDKKNIKKIFFTGENIKPNLSDCDLSFTFDTNSYDDKNIRIPLWYHYIDWFNKGSYDGEKNCHLISPKNFKGSWFKKPKTKSCCAIFSNPKKERFDMIDRLSKYMKVDCYGKPFGNMSHGILDKYEKLSSYKASLCFENGLGSGYVTEKLLHARTCGNLAIYWGTDDVNLDFNTNGFINLKNFNSMEDCAEEVNNVLNDENLYNEIINQPIFNASFFDFDKKVKNKIETLVNI
jgi:hypothetical protein